MSLNETTLGFWIKFWETINKPNERERSVPIPRIPELRVLKLRERKHFTFVKNTF